MTLHEKATHSRTIKAFETLEEDLHLIHNNKYDYSKLVYRRDKDPVVIICPIHGEFNQSISQHKQKKQECPKCAKITKGNTRSTNVAKTWVERANKAHNNKYNYSKAVYTKAHLKTIFICPKHGEFEQQIASHLRGQGCQKCVQHGYHDEAFYKNKKASLYYIRLANGLYKIGITCTSIKERYQGELTMDYTILGEWVFENGSDAYLLEQSCLTKTEEFTYTGDKIFKYGGHTELRTEDVLPAIKQIIKDYNGKISDLLF